MARKDFLRRSPEIAWTETDWNPKARKILAEYAAGRSRDLAKIDVAFHASTEFQRKVLMIVRGLDYGETASYGEIAERAGAPGAARAVGTVMSTNRIPLLIPCHRVTAAGGKLGGYTARDGVNMKERLLKMERSRGGA
jgi:methylated-DNA-[protein]-cysteine S-methyltransferase